MESKEGRSVLQEAMIIRGGSRQADYGDSTQNLKNWIATYDAMFGNEKGISEEDAVKLMIALKFTREKFKHKRDNLVDACGYIDILNKVKEDLSDE